MDNEYEEFFDYLDKLRDSGVTNMYGAAPFLEDEFGMPRTEALLALKAWMRARKSS